jgi:anti-sigma factor RsiW
MNDTTQLGPCADHENEIVELVDGSLGPEQARALRLHLEACARCRAWRHEFAALNARLAAALPRPALSADFAERLRVRLESVARPAERSDLRAAADQEYRRLVESLRRGTRRAALLNGIAAAGVTGCGLVLARNLLPYLSTLAPSLEGAERITALGACGAAVAIGALAWSAMRGALPMFRLRA